MYVDKKIIAIGLLAVCAIVWYMFGGGIHSNGDSATEIKRQLEQVGNNQSEITRRIKSIENGLDNSANRIGVTTERVITVEQRFETITADVDEAGRIIKESQSIIRDIQRTNKK